jgi:hypothetical protein
MASTDAIAATTDALVALLGRAARDTRAFATITVERGQSDDLQQPLAARTPASLSVFLRRVSVSPARHNVPQRIGEDGRRLLPPIPLDLYYLVIPFAGDARLQQRLLGWAVRVLADTPILPSALLNDNGWDGAFAPDETVELAWAPLTTSEEQDAWELAQSNQQPSASYVARTVAIESRQAFDEHALVQSTDLRYRPAVPA